MRPKRHVFCRGECCSKMTWRPLHGQHEILWCTHLEDQCTHREGWHAHLEDRCAFPSEGGGSDCNGISTIDFLTDQKADFVTEQRTKSLDVTCGSWPVPHGMCPVFCVSWPVPHGLCLMACVLWPVPRGLCLVACASCPVQPHQSSRGFSPPTL